MTVDLGEQCSLPLQVVADPTAEQTPVFTLRPATVEDIDDLSRWHNTMARERLLTEIRSLAQWRHELVGHSPASLRARDYQIIVNAGSEGKGAGKGEGEGVGYLELSATLYNPHILYCVAYVVGEQSSYLATFDDVMRGVKQWAVAKFGVCPTLLLFGSGAHSTLNTLIRRTMGGVVHQQAYKWYLRVPDTIAFLRHIQPVLERRLEGSGAHRYTGELKIGFYDLTGIELKFENGRISEMTEMKGRDGYDISFPWHLFWNVVFGDQSPEEIQAILPDVQRGGGKAGVLIETLFPKKKSWLEGLG
jgi:hypothetical protein